MPSKSILDNCSRDYNSTYHNGITLADLLTARSFGLTEIETWAILYQSIQALQDLFLSDRLSNNNQYIPLVTPWSLKLFSKGRVKLCLNSITCFTNGHAVHLQDYLAPEYKNGRLYSDTDLEKMWIFGLGETLKRATIISNVTSQKLCQVLANMTRHHAAPRASLMHLLDVMSHYCKSRQQNRPFSHIIMDLHQEALASMETNISNHPQNPDLKEFIPIKKNDEPIPPFTSTLKKWDIWNELPLPNLLKETAMSMENLHIFDKPPGNVIRPKSLCVPDSQYYQMENNFLPNMEKQSMGYKSRRSNHHHLKKHPIQRAASRLYQAGIDLPTETGSAACCVGPEFVIRASLPNKKFIMADCKGGSNRKRLVTIIMLDGQKIDVTCNPSCITAGQLFEFIIKKEHIEENFMLGLSALIAGDFVFLPSDTKISKILQSGSNKSDIISLTLYLRVRFFLPSLRGIRGCKARHLLYLQLRRSILEHQLPCSFSQIIELNGLALQAEFGNYREIEHGTRDYFLLEHYVPETMACVVDDEKLLRKELVKAHISKKGLEREKAEQDFIIFTQNLPHYGGHFYTATWILKDDDNKEVWLYISAQGINLYERGKSTSNFGPQLYKMFEWRSIQTLCYSKHYLCILPHSHDCNQSKIKKYKLQMDHKKSYFAFRLASLHHQFFLRLRTEYTSLQSLSQQFGIPLKDIKNERNSLYKMENDAALSQPIYMQLDLPDYDTIAETKKFQIDPDLLKRRRSKSVQDLVPSINEEYQNKENESPTRYMHRNDATSFAFPELPERRRGVKMGTKVIANSMPRRMSRSMDAVNKDQDYLEQLSLQSVSLYCSSNSLSKSSNDGIHFSEGDAYVLDSTIKSVSQHNFLPNFQETINKTLLEKLDKMSFTEERILCTATIERDLKGNFGLQITEGSDGNVYVQSVIPGGPAHLSMNVLNGDQVIAVNGLSLLGRKYSESLDLLKNTGQKVEFILSRVTPSFQVLNNTISPQCCEQLVEAKNTSLPFNDWLKKMSFYQAENKECGSTDTESPVEKYVLESCSERNNNIMKNLELNENLLFRPLPNDNDRAVIVDMIPKKQNLLKRYNSTIVSSSSSSADIEPIDAKNHINIPMPRSMGLSRKWRGPVRYPVTPIKGNNNNNNNTGSISDEEQVFI